MKSVNNLVKTIARLRGKNGCPWDKVQTHKTLKRYLIEEAYEVIEAIDNDDSNALMDELGDVLLQVILHAQIAKEKKKFTFEKLASHVNKKMISRHPHVFGDAHAKTPEEVMVHWERLKKKEKPENDTFDGIPRSLPALLKALKVSKKASKEGFDWEDEKDLWKVLKSELHELKTISRTSNKNKQLEELGDLLFMVVNIARWFKLDPEDALNKGIKKFIKRFYRVKQIAKKDIKKLSSKELDVLWERVKNM